MATMPRRSKETLNLIDDLRVKAARRRQLRIIFAASVGTALLILVLTLAVLATTARNPSGQASTTTSSSDLTSAGLVLEVPLQSTTTLSQLTSSFDTLTPLATASASATTTTARTHAFVVAIDPGHQAKADPTLEPIGPGSTRLKARVSSGTQSVNTGAPESELVLAIGLQLKDALEAHGIEVVMTRTTQDVNISNSERAQVANAAGADLFVRIHADGATDRSINGILMLYPANIAGWTDDIAAESKEAASLALEQLLLATGAHDRGLSVRDDITGFNWSDVPVILPEIGLMTNPTEDALLATPEYQAKIVHGLTQAILSYLEVG